MNKVFDVVAGIGALIAIYLFVVNYRGTTAIISSIASNSVAGIKTLQGR